jgi:general secretion pathway protein G
MFCKPHRIRDVIRATRSAGFSLIEIMIVIVIIGMLAGTVTLSTKHYVNKARHNRAKSDIRVIQTAVENH